jgi:hypothetical protein
MLTLIVPVSVTGIPTVLHLLIASAEMASSFPDRLWRANR